MQRMFATAFIFLLGSACAVSTVVSEKQLSKGNSMVAKVIQMLGEEKDKIAADVDAESKTMAEYTEWCDDTITEHSYGIKSAKAKIADLNAVITDATAMIASLEEDIDTLGKEIAEHTADMDEANAIREKDRAEFEKAEAGQVEMVEKLEELQVALKEQMDSIAATPAPVVEGEAEAFLQVDSNNAGSTFMSTSFANKIVAGDAKVKRALTLAVNSIWVDPESK
jgi:chromosome segregation ATPase